MVVDMNDVAEMDEELCPIAVGADESGHKTAL